MGGIIPYTGDPGLYEHEESELSISMHGAAHCALSALSCGYSVSSYFGF